MLQPASKGALPQIRVQGELRRAEVVPGIEHLAALGALGQGHGRSVLTEEPLAKPPLTRAARCLQSPHAQFSNSAHPCLCPA